jgi:serine/threonine protein kinase
VSLAARFYRRAAQQGHADGANNFGFCLEHGRGVEQNFELAGDYYRFAADRGHPEAKLNHARCLRLLGRWEPPDRSSDSVSHPPSPDCLSEIFRDFCQSPAPRAAGDDARLLNQLARLKNVAPAVWESSEVAWVPDRIESGKSSVVKFAVDSESNPIAVKIAKNPKCAELIRPEAAILEGLKHPLVLEMRACIRDTDGARASIVTEYAARGSLAGHLRGERGLRGPNRVAKVIAGIALAMRFVHARRVTHCDLTPENILLAWDWSVRIADFASSVVSAASDGPSVARAGMVWHRPSSDLRYFAPECFDGIFFQASDVFAFGLILLEILAGRPPFPKGLRPDQVMCMVTVKHSRPEVPDFVLPRTRALIEACLVTDPLYRPTFEEIVERLKEMEFRVTREVNSSKVKAFVKWIEEWEVGHPGE